MMRETSPHTKVCSSQLLSDPSPRTYVKPKQTLEFIETLLRVQRDNAKLKQTLENLLQILRDNAEPK